MLLHCLQPQLIQSIRYIEALVKTDPKKAKSLLCDDETLKDHIPEFLLQVKTSRRHLKCAFQTLLIVQDHLSYGHLKKPVRDLFLLSLEGSLLTSEYFSTVMRLIRLWKPETLRHSLQAVQALWENFDFLSEEIQELQDIIAKVEDIPQAQEEDTRAAAEDRMAKTRELARKTSSLVVRLFMYERLSSSCNNCL